MHNLESDISSFLKHKLDGCTASGDPSKQMEELRNFLQLERNMRRPADESVSVRHLRPASRPHLRVVT
jgi:hypothetical protein